VTDNVITALGGIGVTHAFFDWFLSHGIQVREASREMHFLRRIETE